MNDTAVSARQSRQRAQLIVALLQDARMEKAAASIGISTTTAWRMFKTPEFVQEYRKARSDAFAQSLRQLQQASEVAVTAVVKMLNDPKVPPATRLQAAKLVLESGGRSFEVEEVWSRLHRLEEFVSQRESLEKKDEPVFYEASRTTTRIA